MCAPINTDCLIGGCEWYYDLQLTDSDGVPVDLFFSTVALTLTATKAPEGAPIAVIPVDVRLMPDSQGNFGFFLDKTKTATMTPIPGDYEYEGDIIITYTDGTCEVLLTAVVTARQVKD